MLENLTTVDQIVIFVNEFNASDVAIAANLKQDGRLVTSFSRTLIQSKCYKLVVITGYGIPARARSVYLDPQDDLVSFHQAYGFTIANPPLKPI